MGRLLRRRAACLCVPLIVGLCLVSGCVGEPEKKKDGDLRGHAFSIVGRLPVTERGLSEIVVSPSGAFVAYGNATHGIEIVNALSRVKVHNFPPRAGEKTDGYGFQFSGDNSVFVVADSNRLTAYDVGTWKSLADITLGKAGASWLTLAALPRSRELLLGDGHSLFRWLPGNQPRELPKPRWVLSFQVFPDGARVVSTQSGLLSTYKIWTSDLRDDADPTPFEEGGAQWCSTGNQKLPEYPRRCPSVSPTGTHLAAPGAGCVFLWDFPGKTRHEIDVPDRVSDVAFLKGGDYLASSPSHGRRLSVINVLDRQIRATRTLDDQIVAIAAFQNEPKLAVLTQKELLIVAIDLAALDKKAKP